jgi:RNA polymerase sigma factor (sigma-70 family)
MLTTEQQTLVSEHLYLVDKVIHFDIRRNMSNPDYSHEDMYQTGCIGLCMAAAAYDGSRPFKAFARKAVFNQIIDYCRGINRHGRVDHLDEFTDAQMNAATGVSGDVAEYADFHIILDRMAELKPRYSGVTLKGITAIELKLKGLTGADVAKLYGVPPNQVSAWIARARQKLLKDEDFMAAIS